MECMENYFLNALETSPIVVHPAVETAYLLQQQRSLLVGQVLQQQWEAVYAQARTHPALFLMPDAQVPGGGALDRALTTVFAIALHHAHPKDLFFLGSSFGVELGRAQQFDVLQTLNTLMQTLEPLFLADPLSGSWMTLSALESRVCAFFKGYILSEEHVLSSGTRVAPVWHFYQGNQRQFASSFGAHSLVGSQLLFFAIWAQHQNNPQAFDVSQAVNRFLWNLMHRIVLFSNGQCGAEPLDVPRNVVEKALGGFEALLRSQEEVLKNALNSEHMDQHFWLEGGLPLFRQSPQSAQMLSEFVHRHSVIKDSAQYQIAKILYEKKDLTPNEIKGLEFLRNAILV